MLLLGVLLNHRDFTLSHVKIPSLDKEGEHKTGVQFLKSEWFYAISSVFAQITLNES